MIREVNEMILTVYGVFLITAIFGGFLYWSLRGFYDNKKILFYSVVFGLLFVTPVGDGIQKWGEQNRTTIEKEVRRVPIMKNEENKISKIISEQDGVYLYLTNKKSEVKYFIPQKNIREIESSQKEGSYLAVYQRYDPDETPYLVPFIKNDKYFIFYRERRKS